MFFRSVSRWILTIGDQSKSIAHTTEKRRAVALYANKSETLHTVSSQLDTPIIGRMKRCFGAICSKEHRKTVQSRKKPDQTSNRILAALMSEGTSIDETYADSCRERGMAARVALGATTMNLKDNI